MSHGELGAPQPENSLAQPKDDRPFDFPGGLTPYEKVWRDRQPWLRSRGYELRSRYHPGWTPSWKGTDKPYLLCEDGVLTMVRG